jgi:hypothetical protein
MIIVHVSLVIKVKKGWSISSIRRSRLLAVCGTTPLPFNVYSVDVTAGSVYSNK